MWIGVLWAGLRVSMWITHVGGKFRHGLLEKSLKKRSQNLAPVLVIISGNSLVFSRKMITSTDFYWCCAAGASAPVVAKNQSPSYSGDLGPSGRKWPTEFEMSLSGPGA